LSFWLLGALGWNAKRQSFDKARGKKNARYSFLCFGCHIGNGFTFRLGRFVGFGATMKSELIFCIGCAVALWAMPYFWAI